MSTPVEMSAESVVVGCLAAAFGDPSDTVPRVSTDMPLKYGAGDGVVPPFVWINALPGPYVQRAWQGRTMLWVVALDVDGFAVGRIDAQQTAARACRLLDEQATGFVSLYGQITRVECTTPAIRPDWNDRVRRYGGTVEVWIRPAQSAG